MCAFRCGVMLTGTCNLSNFLQVSLNLLKQPINAVFVSVCI